MKYNIENDAPLMEAINYLSRNFDHENPTYKFRDILGYVESQNYVTWFDVKTLDDYYDCHIADYILIHSEYYFGEKITRKSQIKSRLGEKNWQFDFGRFCSLLINVYDYNRFGWR